MSTKENVVVSEVSEVSINPHYTAAQERVQELRRMRELIPHFFIPASPRDAKRLHPVASVSPEFVELTAMAKTNQNALVRGESKSPAEIRDLLIYGEAYSPLADELEALAQFVRISIAAARNLAGSDALTTYALAQRLAKQPETASLAPVVADMRRALGRARKSTAEEVAKRDADKAQKAAEKAAQKAAKAAAVLSAKQSTQQQSS
jgi:hypothetical protein